MNDDLDVNKICQGHEVKWSELTTTELIHEVKLRQYGKPNYSEWAGSIDIFLAELWRRKFKSLFRKGNNNG